MTAATPTAATPAFDDDALVELRRTSAGRKLAARSTTALLAGGFLLVAFGALALPAHHTFSVDALLVTVCCYLLASRVQFEFGTGFAIPTQALFVVMWVTLPPRLLPLAVCSALVVGAVPELLARRMPPERLALQAVASWHAVGPALVLYLWGPETFSWSATPIYALALLAQFAFDYTSAFLITRAVVAVRPLDQLRTAAPAYAVDALLAPLGLLAAYPAVHWHWTPLLLMPVLLMFSTFAKERQYRIDNALELSSAYRGTAMLLGDVIEADDEYTGSHSRHVVDLVLGVADRLGLDPAQRRRAEFAALLHDVGKVKIPPEIINKPGALDENEWAVMRTHTILGEQMLEQIGGLLGEVGHIVRSCHERWDGAGYPDMLSGETIPLEARIVCACDAWSAMTTDRSYRKARTTDDALAELRASSGTHFDPRVVDALEAIVAV